MKFNLWINKENGNVKLFELDKGLGAYPAGINPMRDDYIGEIDLPVEKPKKTVVKEAERCGDAGDITGGTNIEMFFIPRNAKNIKCTYEVEE